MSSILIVASNRTGQPTFAGRLTGAVVYADVLHDLAPGAGRRRATVPVEDTAGHLVTRQEPRDLELRGSRQPPGRLARRFATPQRPTHASWVAFADRQSWQRMDGRGSTGSGAAAP